jgi:cytosine/adenosine deaminase-related metal-dependent hydrolase
MILRSAYLIRSDGRVAENAEVVFDGDRIGALRTRCSGPVATGENVIDLGRAAILPGLVNAHTHLELTAAKPLVKNQRRFTDWIRHVVQTTSDWTPEDFSSSLREGVRQSAQAGTTTLGDIGRSANDVTAYAESGMRARLFIEVIDFNPKTADQTFESLKERAREIPSGERLCIGIGPHTPYTVSGKLLRKCAGLAHEHGWPLCIHVAETKAEMEFLRFGTGEIRDFRHDFGVPRGWRPPRVSPVRYLQRLGCLDRPATLIHCNYVMEEDFEIIERSKSTVVFCPRSHKYFRHREHPFRNMLERGISVALGTDSAISSPTLSVLDEMKFVRRQYADVAPVDILRMATVNGLQALGFEADAASLEPGCRADLVGVTLPEKELEAHGPLEALFARGSRVAFSMVGGRVVFDKKHAAK